MDYKIAISYAQTFMDDYLETMTDEEFLAWIEPDKEDEEVMELLKCRLIKLEYYNLLKLL